MVMYERAIHHVNIVDTWSKCPWKRNIFLRPLIDELKELWEEGVETYDAYASEYF